VMLCRTDRKVEVKRVDKMIKEICGER
jgi:hypothetical protein